MLIHTPIGLFQKYHNTLRCPSKILYLHCFQFLLGRKTYCLLIHQPVLSSICQVLIKSISFFLNASNSSVSVILIGGLSAVFLNALSSPMCIHSFQPRATLRKWVSQQFLVFECYDQWHPPQYCVLRGIFVERELFVGGTQRGYSSKPLNLALLSVF